MIREKRKFERFMNPTDEVLDIWKKLIDIFNKDKDYIKVKTAVAGDDQVYVEKNGRELINISGSDKFIEIKIASFYRSPEKYVIKTKEDLDKFLG